MITTPRHKRLALGLWSLLLLLACSPATSHAQTVPTASACEEIRQFLSDVESHNEQLRSLHKANLALMADRRADNRPGATSVEYSPFYQSDYQGVASSELIVQQEFDFPTLYASRQKSGNAMQQVLDLQYGTLRRDVLLQAINTLYDLCEARQTQHLLHNRMAAADTLLTAYERRLTQGDATRLDVNRIKMDKMELSAEALRCESRIQTLIHELTRLNGGEDLTSASITLVSDPEAVLRALPYANAVRQLATAPASTGSHEVQLAEAAKTLARREMSEARQSWLPQLTLGYRRNTERQEALNGFIVGMSLPLWSNKSKVKAARLRQEAAESDLAVAMSAAEARRQSLDAEVSQLRLLLEAYDVTLMHEQLTLLHHAVEAGQLSLIEYYTEADRIHTLLQTRLQTLVEYHKLLTELYRDDI